MEQARKLFHDRAPPAQPKSPEKNPHSMTTRPERSVDVPARQRDKSVQIARSVKIALLHVGKVEKRLRKIKKLLNENPTTPSDNNDSESDPSEDSEEEPDVVMLSSSSSSSG
ncbi:unnamed protein product [Microthlaspi erraticum]|uniref:Uncharacterized protein n=1 Tax=Microthlaspi erraticum TaxID=1685480 RepID=A0A6D2KC79_9BRAS|nr:unnamed protein product [Microthlaspi erraticum]CAA7045743.1 unnamed protein product [Microthlaspi erraticum]